jgi:hypothetical protein
MSVELDVFDVESGLNLSQNVDKAARKMSESTRSPGPRLPFFSFPFLFLLRLSCRVCRVVCRVVACA